MKILITTLLLICACALPSFASSGPGGSTTVSTPIADSQTIASDWKSGGLHTVVTTPKKDGESSNNWMLRHKQAVDAAKITFPPDATVFGGFGWVAGVTFDTISVGWLSQDYTRTTVSTTHDAPTSNSTWKYEEQHAVLLAHSYFP